MGKIKRRILFDTCIMVYLVERHEQYQQSIVQAMGRYEATHAFCISPLIKMECLVSPLKLKNQFLAADFFDF